MGFNRNGSSGWLVVGVLLWGSVWCGAQEKSDRPKITVDLLNRAGVPRDVLASAENEAGRIFRAAGIEVVWNDCSVSHQCHHAPGPQEFVLSIVPDGKTSSDLVYGVAFLDPAGNGKYADVFFRRIEQAYNNAPGSVPRLLGTVAAHELGHLVLGSHSHGYSGLMTPVWKEPTLHAVGAGSLLFTREQSSLMKAKVGAGFNPSGTTEFTLVRRLPFLP